MQTHKSDVECTAENSIYLCFDAKHNCCKSKLIIDVNLQTALATCHRRN